MLNQYHSCLKERIVKRRMCILLEIEVLKKNTSFYIHTNCVSDPKLLVIIAIKLISGTLGNSTGVTSYQTSLNNEKQ